MSEASTSTPSETPGPEPWHLPSPLTFSNRGGGGGGAVHAGSRAAVAPVAGQQMPFPSGLTFESQTARSDGRCMRGTEGGERGRWGWGGGVINLVPGSCM